GEAARQAMAQYDTNKDGFLDAKELEACPPLKVALKKFDKDGDGRISTDELTQRLTLYNDSRTGIVSLPCQVYLDGKPLSGAKVTFVPETFLGPAFKPASGTSDSSGGVLLQIEGMPLPGVQLGLYRVQISMPNETG